MPKIFSIKKLNVSINKILDIFGLNFKIFNKDNKQVISYFRAQYLFYLSRYNTNFIDNRTLEDLKYFSTSEYYWRKFGNKLWLVYLAMLIENNKDEKDIEFVVKKYLYFHKLKDVENFFSVSYWFNSHGFSNPAVKKSAQIYQKILDCKENNAFYNLIKDKSIAVVGNGPCEIGKNKGEEIDKHDIVIRFNEFHTKGYEKDYGTKCDVWANYFCNVDFLNYKERPNCKLYLWTNDSYCFQNKIAIDNAYSCINKNWDICCNIRRQAWETFGLNFDPTSGFVVIMQIYNLLGNFDNVDFYGFKFLEDENVQNKHYFKTEYLNSYAGHNFDSEATFLKDFINSNTHVKTCEIVTTTK